MILTAKKIVKLLLSLFLLTACGALSWAQEVVEETKPDDALPNESSAEGPVKVKSLEGYTGFLWIRNEVYDEAPGDRGNDTLAGLLGLSAIIEVSGSLTFSPAVVFYMEYYDLVGSDGLSMPSDMASAGQMTTLGIFMRIPFCFTFDLKPFTIEADVGPAFWLRFPLWGPGEAERNDIFASFYKDGRFIYITGAGRLVYRIGETWSLLGGIEIFLPVCNLWIQDDLPISEGLGIAFHIGIRKEL